MKKILLILLIVVIVPVFAFSASISKKDQAKIANLSNLASNMTNSEAIQLFGQNHKKTTGPVLLNLLLPAGVGSFVQGDNVGGIISLGGEALSCTLLVSGISQFKNAIDLVEESIPTFSSTYDIDDLTEVGKLTANAQKIEDYVIKGTSLCLTAAIGLSAIKVFELVRPFSYAKSFDNKLNEELVTVLVPTITPTGQIGATLGAKFSF